MSFSLLAWMKMGNKALLQAWLGLETSLTRRRQRRQLLGLTDHLLKDIGVNRCDAWREGTKWRG